MSVAKLERPAAPAAPAAPTTRRWAPLGEFPARPHPLTWPATELPRDEVIALVRATPFVVDRPRLRTRRLLTVGLLLDWLDSKPGTTWQQRWLANEDDVAGPRWRQALGRWLAQHGHTCRWHQDDLSVAIRIAISVDVVRPSLAWLLTGAMGQGALVRVFAANRDPDGFARLRAQGTANPEVSELAVARMLHRSTVIMAAKGGEPSSPRSTAARNARHRSPSAPPGPHHRNRDRIDM